MVGLMHGATSQPTVLFSDTVDRLQTFKDDSYNSACTTALK